MPSRHFYRRTADGYLEIADREQFPQTEFPLPLLAWDLTKEKSKLEAVDSNEWGNWNSPTEFLNYSEDQVSISRSRYKDSDQGRDNFAEQYMDTVIDPQLIEDAPLSQDEPCFSPPISPIIEPKHKNAYRGSSQNRLRRPYCDNPFLSDGTIQSTLHSKVLPAATMLEVAIGDEAVSDYSQGLEARGRQACKQSKKLRSSIDEKAESRVFSPTKKQKSSHNAIEKRYRNNLNNKISALQKLVPSLRGALSHGQVGDDAKATIDESTHKYKKATILAQAIEYIAYLEESTERLGRETCVLKAQVVAFKKQVIRLDAIVVGSTECSQIQNGETLISIQKSFVKHKRSRSLSQ